MCISRSEITIIELILCGVYTSGKKEIHIYTIYKFADSTYELNVFKLLLKLALHNIKMSNKMYANDLIF